MFPGVERLSIFERKIFGCGEIGHLEMEFSGCGEIEYFEKQFPGVEGSTLSEKVVLS